MSPRLNVQMELIGLTPISTRLTLLHPRTPVSSQVQTVLGNQKPRKNKQA